MKEKRISFCQGKGSLTHNNRYFIAENVDRCRMRNNYTFIRKDIGCVYEHYLLNQQSVTTPNRNAMTEKFMVHIMNLCFIRSRPILL